MSSQLHLTEIFASVQGETSFTGYPTTFVRLSGCNLRCSWCDTPYSFSRGPVHSSGEVLKKVRDYGLKHVCITGGEPLLQKSILPFMSQLCNEGFVVSVETGGSLPIEAVDKRVHVIIDVKCPGSAMEDRNRWENLGLLEKKDEVKFVIRDREDFEYARRVCEEYRLYEQAGQVLFSPVFEDLEAHTLVSWILKEKLPVRLNLQTHKFIWHPETQGV